MTIAKVLVSGEARAGDVLAWHIASYRELVRLHTHLSDESAGYQNEIQAPSGRPLSRVHPGLRRCLLAERLSRAQNLSQCSGYRDRRSGGGLPGVANPGPSARMARPTAKKLVEVARRTASSGRALSARSASLRVLCDQLEQTQANLARLQAEIAHLIAHDPGVKGEAPDPRLWHQDGGRPARLHWEMYSVLRAPIR
jgi:transposase